MIQRKYMYRFVIIVFTAMVLTYSLICPVSAYAENKGDGTQIENNKDGENKKTTAEQLKEEESVVPDDSVFRVSIGYEFEDGSFDEWASGSGFLIESKYILTSQTFSDASVGSALYSKIVETKEEAYKRVGVTLRDAKETEDHIKIRITNINGDEIECKESITKNGLGVLILKKASKAPICVFSSDKTIMPASSDTVNIKFAGGDNQKAVITPAKGTVSAAAQDAQAGIFTFKADTGGISPIGSPIYDDKGNVIGMATAMSSSVVTAVEQSTLQAFLASNGVEYKTAEQVLAERAAEEEDKARKDAQNAENIAASTKKLKSAIANAEDIDRDIYTEESLSDLDTSVKEAEGILKAENKTQEQLDTASQNINTAMDDLVEKGFFEKFFGGVGVYIAGLIILITAASTAFFIIKKKKKKAEILTAENEKESFGYSEDLGSEELRTQLEEMRKSPGLGTIREDDFADIDKDIDITTREKPAERRVTMDTAQHGITYADNTGDDEVSILDDGSADTTVLEGNMPSAHLIRCDSGKRIEITKGDFLIGKERKKVDYCIGGDPSVSRIHASIRIISGGFYIEDQNSTNYTFVNGNQIPAYKPVYLPDGAIIRLSDVEFEFREG